MMPKNYIAHSSEYNEHQEFETFEEAEKWLKSTWDDLADEGYDSSIDGGDYIAKISHRSTFIETDNKANYPSDEEWPYAFEQVGRIELKEIEQEGEQINTPR